MRSYIKIYGPPVLKAVKELEKIAAGMPEICITDIITSLQPIDTSRHEGQQGFLGLGHLSGPQEPIRKPLD